MKWTVKLLAEVVDGKQIEHEIATIERADGISPATVGLTIAEGKGILESLQKEIVTPQVQQHGASIPSCPRCARAYRTKGYYPSTLRSVHGKVGMRIRQLRGCSCAGSQSCSFSTLFTNKNPITPELRYLTAKMAAQDGPARVLLGSYGSASSVIVRHRRSTILRYDSRAENAGATSPRRATPCYGLPSHPAACRFPTSCNKASWGLSSRRAKQSNS
jgi:hypothetical protein